MREARLGQNNHYMYNGVGASDKITITFMLLSERMTKQPLHLLCFRSLGQNYNYFERGVGA